MPSRSSECTVQLKRRSKTLATPKRGKKGSATKMGVARTPQPPFQNPPKRNSKTNSRRLPAGDTAHGLLETPGTEQRGLGQSLLGFQPRLPPPSSRSLQQGGGRARITRHLLQTANLDRAPHGARGQPRPRPCVARRRSRNGQREDFGHQETTQAGRDPLWVSAQALEIPYLCEPGKRRRDAGCLRQCTPKSPPSRPRLAGVRQQWAFTWKENAQPGACGRSA